MVQKTFSIYADDLSGCRLFIEAGVQHIASWFVDTLTGSLKAFEFFQFEDVDEGNIDDTVRAVRLHSKLMDMQMDAALVVWEHPACTFVPREFFDESIADGYLDIISGESGDSKLLHEPFKEYVILSRYPAKYANAIRRHLAAGPFSHKFSSLLKRYTKISAAGETSVRIVFYPSRFIITATESGVLQIIQCIQYSTAEDVLYSIMHICNEYGFALETTPVIASGFINSGSTLHDTLYRYLENFEIEKSGDATFAAEGFAEHPHQYFLPFIQ